MKPLILALAVWYLCISSVQAAPIPQAGIMDSVSLFLDNVMAGFGISFYTAQKWVYGYFLHDREASEAVQGKIDRIVALNRLRNDRHAEPDCCKDAGCYVNGRLPCTALCVPCDRAEKDLERYL